MAKVLPTSVDETSHEEENLLQRLTSLLKGNSALTLNDASGETIELPQQVRDVFQQVIERMARGQLVEVKGFPQELTPGQAADFLRIPRAQVLALIQDGTLPIQDDEHHRRIRLQDAIDYQRAKAERMHQGIIEIARISQELGLYDIPLSSEDVANLSHQDEP